MAEFKVPKFVYKDKPISVDKCYQELADMNYQSPVEVIYQGFETKLEGEIFEAIQSYGVAVDKDELIKALQYDRDQYRKGFADGARGATDRIKTEVSREIFEDIEAFMLDALIADKFPAKCINPDKFAELKKKYMEEQE